MKGSARVHSPFKFGREKCPIPDVGSKSQGRKLIHILAVIDNEFIPLKQSLSWYEIVRSLKIKERILVEFKDRDITLILDVRSKFLQRFQKLGVVKCFRGGGVGCGVGVGRKHLLSFINS